jgi:hypothetical protein
MTRGSGIYNGWRDAAKIDDTRLPALTELRVSQNLLIFTAMAQFDAVHGPTSRQAVGLRC